MQIGVRREKPEKRKKEIEPEKDCSHEPLFSVTPVLTIIRLRRPAYELMQAMAHPCVITLQRIQQKNLCVPEV